MSSEDIERRKRLESAVEDDDWSSVIDGQTKLTKEPKAEAEAPTATIIRFVILVERQLFAETRNDLHSLDMFHVQPTSDRLRWLFPNSSPFSSDGMPIGVGPDGMAPPPLPPGIAAPALEAPPAPPASECNDLEFTLENVDKVGSRTTVNVCLCDWVEHYKIFYPLFCFSA